MFRNEKIAANISQLAAEFTRGLIKNAFITVTRVDLSDTGEHATILCTVFPETQQDSALSVLQKEMGAFRRFVSGKMRIKKIPSLAFALDIGEENRRIVEELLKKT